MTIDARIDAGDMEAVHDMAREAIAGLEVIAERSALLLTDEPEALKRLSEVRMRQTATGRQWHGSEVSGDIEDTGAMDRKGKEPRGPRIGLESVRRAMAGKSETKRGRRC